MNSYTTLATVYEKLMKDCDYDKWSQYLLTILDKYSKGKKGLDLACGSGKMTRILCKNGYKMSAGDISTEMLTEAKKLSLKEKLNVDYFRSDITNLVTIGKFDFVTIINDGINYVSQDKLQKAFKGIYKQLNKDGLLIFDISSEYKLKNVIGNNLFGEDWEDFAYLWFNKLREDSIEMDLTFFIKEGEFYRRAEESHVQYIHKTEQILSVGSQCGFEIIEYTNLDKAERINFVFRRK